MNCELLTDGFTIVKGVFTEKEVQLFRKISLGYFNNNGGFPDSTGRAKPDWIKEDELSTIYEKWNSKNVEKIIQDIIKKEVEFIGHNDLHLNRNAGWHKDRLNGEARKFEINNPWEDVSGETMQIYKVNFYMQSHKHNSDALTVIKGSHKDKSIDLSKKTTQIHPDVGDIVVFDQRITHRGCWSGGYDRILLCMGYGVKNIFFEQFKRGTEFRQILQNRRKR